MDPSAGYQIKATFQRLQTSGGLFDKFAKEIKERTKIKGVQLTNAEPQQVTKKSKVVFIHSNSIQGILIELIQRDEEG